MKIECRPISTYPAPETILIPLGLRGGNPVGFALVDATDVDLGRFHWYRLASGYAVRVTRCDGRRRMIYLHRAVLGLTHGDPRPVDHRNGDRLDCRRSNLRVITPSGNAQNRGPNRGRDLPRNVYTSGPRWRVQFKANGRPLHLGTFETIEEADAAASAWRAEHMPFSPDAAAHHGVSL